MPRSIQCGSCGAQLKLPDSIPSGKKLLCPKCRQEISLAVEDAGAPAGEALLDDPVHAPADLPPLQATLDESPTPPVREQLATASTPFESDAEPSGDKLCPFCGEQIKPSAIKCRHCGEFLTAHPNAGRGAPYGARPAANELTPAEYVTGVLFAPVGLLIGLVWAVKRAPKARNMLVISSAMTVLMAAVAFCTYWYWPRQPDTHVDPGRMPPRFFSPDLNGAAAPEFGDTDDLVPSSPSSPDPGIDLNNQPQEIRQALQANVRVELPGMAYGSGVVLKRDGDWALILSNRHVVDLRFAQSRGRTFTPGDRIVVRITYINNLSTRGKVAWEDPKYDLVLLKARCPDDIQPATWQPIPKLAIGEDCFAVGNPVRLGWTYTRGVISALRQRSTEASPFQSGPVIQTDVAIAGGSSGGGLYNKNGLLIGINTAIVDPQIAKGIGFAIQTTVLQELQPPPLGLAPATQEPADSEQAPGTDPPPAS